MLRQRGHNVRHQNRQCHFEQACVRYLAFKDGVAVVDADEYNANDNRVLQSRLSVEPRWRSSFTPENRNWLACGCDAPVAEGKGDASSPVGQPPASGDRKKCAEGGAFTFR